MALAITEVRSEHMIPKNPDPTERVQDIRANMNGSKKRVLGNYVVYSKGFEPGDKEDLETKILKWFAYSKDIGSSSCAMMFSFIGRTDVFGVSHPFDHDDFGRCLRALRIDRRLRGMLSTPAKLSPFWAAMVKRWGEIEAIYQNDVELQARTDPHSSRTDEILKEILGSVDDGFIHGRCTDAPNS
jgi:hypothetical protein